MIVRIESQQLGPIDVPEDRVIEFPRGLPGFPGVHHFCLLEPRPGSRFKLLQSARNAGLAFVVTDPLSVDPDYPLETVRSLAAPVGIAQDELLAVAVIVTVPPQPGRMTANLLAPVAMGIDSRLGLQVVLHDTQYQVRHAL